MKILRLDLLAFGPFTDLSLDLSDGHEGLHLIYGPNEAGKSSTLRALSQMLYGIPVRSPDDFIHPYTRMRIGGTLRRPDGSALAFIRRKGRANTLRGPDDTAVIEETELLTCLGGVDEDLFATMFGIDHGRLVRGGEEIIQGGGDVGRILFAAGSGIADLRKIQADLQAEAEDLFKPSGQKPRINEGIRNLKRMQKAISEAELPGREWDRHDKALRTALHQKRDVEADLEEKQSELNRLERITKALPLIARRKELLDAHGQIADAVLLPEDFSKRRAEAFEALKVAQNLAEQAQANLTEIRQNRENLKVDDRLLARADRIEAFYQELGSHRKARNDRPRLEGLLSGARAEAKDILKGLGGDRSADGEDLRLEKTAVIRVRELGGAYEGLTARKETAEEAIETRSRQVRDLTEQLAETDDPPDIAELEAALERVRSKGDLEARFQTETQEIRNTEQDLQRAIEKLPLWSGATGELAALKIPPMETIDAFETRLGDAADTVKRLQTEQEELDRNRSEVEEQIHRIRLSGDVPTEVDLEAARERRDEGWKLVRTAWEIGDYPESAAREFIDGPPPALGLADAYETSVRTADSVADRLRREADRVAHQAALAAEREKLATRHRDSTERLKAARTNLADIEAEWAAAWAPAGILPRSPREMRAWAGRQEALAARTTEIRERKNGAEALREEIQKLTAEIGDALKPVGEPGPKEDETLTALSRRAKNALDRIHRLRTRREQLRADLATRETELKEAGSRAGKAEKALADWRRQWAGAMIPLGLTQEASPSQAEAVIDDIKRFFEKRKEAAILEKRIASIDAEVQRFAEETADFARREAPDLADLPFDRRVPELHARLTRARDADTRRQGLEKQAAQEEKRLKDAQRRISEIEARLGAMCEEAGCREHEALPEAEERSARRARLESDLERLNQDLRELSAGLPLADFIESASAPDPDTLPPRMDRLTEEIESLHARKSDLDQTIGSEQTELARMDGSARAAELAEESQSILARLEGEVDQYVRLRLASAVLNQAIERYREKNQGPILSRATELFAHMTLGAFEGLRLEFDEHGEGFLVGVRPGGREVVRVEGMSEGTADQLYLAVRLASLEAYLAKNEPMPFVVDDILIKFDDDRAAATLRVLAELSGRTQVIFFTHHRHLVDLAEKELDAERLFTHTLNV